MEKIVYLICIDAPHFAAAVFTREGKVFSCAPILQYMMGWTEEAVQRYCDKKGWTIVSKSISS